MIELREFFDSDISSITKHANNYNVSRYMASRMPYPYTEDDAKWWVETGSRLSASLRIFGYSFDTKLFSFCNDTFDKVLRRSVEPAAEIGYWIAEEHWGKGIATEAVTIMTSSVFSDKDIVRLSAPVFSPNKASMRVLEKCGYSLEAVHRKAVFKNGEFMDEHVFVKLRS